MNRIVDGLKQLGDLVDAKQRISVEDESDKNLSEWERPGFEGCVASVGDVYRQLVHQSRGQLSTALMTTSPNLDRELLPAYSAAQSANRVALVARLLINKMMKRPAEYGLVVHTPCPFGGMP